MTQIVNELQNDMLSAKELHKRASIMEELYNEISSSDDEEDQPHQATPPQVKESEHGMKTSSDSESHNEALKELYGDDSDEADMQSPYHSEN